MKYDLMESISRPRYSFCLVFFALIFYLFSPSGAKAQFTANEYTSKGNNKLSQEQILDFAKIYQDELGHYQPCPAKKTNTYTFCFDTLKNQGNAPFILLPKQSPIATIVLFHGLSDSPFFMSSIAENLVQKGFIVIAPLTPGHGKKEANADMKDDNLKSRWYAHVNAIVDYAEDFNLPLVLGGFSTGGAFATQYTLANPDKVEALLLFSAALKLSSSAENIAKVWGSKALAKWLDGDYQSIGPHPFKYPKVATYSALVLIDVIKDIRAKLENSSIQKPIFVAHSMADNVTLFEGVNNLTEKVKGEHLVFKIDESYDLCHADLPMSAPQIINLDFDKSHVNTYERCAVPKANPLHPRMLMMLNVFLEQHLSAQ